MTFDTTTGVLSGIPALGSKASYLLIFNAINGIDPVGVQPFTLTVRQAPAITSLDHTTFQTGQAGTFTVTANGIPAATLSETGALPGGVTFDPATGILGGTPAAGSSGTYALTFKATNGIGTDATQNFSIFVAATPAITSLNTATLNAGTPGAFTVTATGSPAPVLKATGALPSGVTFDATTGVLSGTPAAGSGGSYALTFGAANGIGPDVTQAFTLVVTQAPALTSASTATLNAGTAGAFTVTATGSPAPLLSETGALPGGITFDATTGILSGTPTTVASGIYLITFTAANGMGPDATQTFTLFVIGGGGQTVTGTAPAFTSLNTATLKVGTAVAFLVSTSGSPAPLLTETGGLPGGLSFDATNGILSGTPATGSGGNYALVFKAANGTAPDASQSFMLTITEAQAPSGGGSSHKSSATTPTNSPTDGGGSGGACPGASPFVGNVHQRVEPGKPLTQAATTPSHRRWKWPGVTVVGPPLQTVEVAGVTVGPASLAPYALIQATIDPAIGGSLTSADGGTTLNVAGAADTLTISLMLLPPTDNGSLPLG